MIWHSTFLMTVIDLTILIATATAGWMLARHRIHLAASDSIVGPLMVVCGLTLIGVFYLVDLVVMWGLPLLVTRSVAAAAMEDLHLNYSWIVALISIVCLVGGFGATVRRLSFQTDRASKSEARAAEELRNREAVEAKARLARFAVDHSADAVYWVRFDARIGYVNQAACRMLGYSYDEFTSMSVSDIDPDFPEATWPAHWEKMKSAGSLTFEAHHKIKDGRVFPVEIQSTFLEHEGQEYVYAFVRDITERKRGEVVLRESETRFRRLYERSPLAYHSLDSTARILMTNPAWLELLGYTEQEVIDKWFGEFLDGESAQYFDKTVFPRYRKTGAVHDVQFEMVRGDGTIVTVEITGKVGYDAEGRFERTHCILHNITERKRAEEELRISREQLRNLAARLHTVREEEKTVMARKLHEELGQALIGLKLDFHSFVQSLPSDLEELRERGHALLSVIGTTADSVRELSTALRPAMLTGLGLVAAVEWEVEQFRERTGIECELLLPTEAPTIDPDRETAIFRILQEALTNVARHAAAQRVQVSVEVMGAELSVVVQDDGKGISDADLTSSRSMGLISMRVRAAALQGSVSISALADGGTAVTLTAPIVP